MDELLTPCLDAEQEAKKELLKGCPMYVLGNKSRINGAVQMCSKDVMGRVSGFFKQDFWILPSSIHETLLVPIGIMDVSGLLQMVKEVNEAEVELCDQLSDKVQYYDRKKGTLENAERRNQKSTFFIMNGELYTGKGPMAA